MSLDILPKLRISLDADLRGRLVDEFAEATKIHFLGEEGLDVDVKGLPVGVVEVVLLRPFERLVVWVLFC